MYEVAQHIADVRLLVSAPSVEDLFRDAVRGMYAVMRGEPAPDARPVQRTITVEDSADRTALLVDFLNEVLHRTHVARELFDGVSFARFEEVSLQATLTGVAPAAFDEDVKAVTYHEADVVERENVWHTTLVFDI
ncbi:MAG TPA: archease [Thermoanaerobaculia bacterium]